MPAIIDVSTNLTDDIVNEAAVGGSLSTTGDGAFLITVQFNESMDTQASFTPVISFPNSNIDFTNSIAFDSGSWSTTTFPNDTYVFQFDVLDADVALLMRAINVTGARGATGAPQDGLFTFNDIFDIDTDIPDVVATAPTLITDTGLNTTDGLTNDDTPVVQVTMPASGLVAGDIVQLVSGSTIYAEYEVTGSEGATVDITVGATVAGSSSTVAAALPAGDTDLTVSYLDTAGNTRDGTASVTVSVDTTAPTTVSIVLDSSTLIVGETTGVTITFSEAVEALEIADFTVANGALSALATADGGTTWTATFTPSETTSETTNIITLADSFTDLAGNGGTGTSSANYVVDTVVPTVATMTLAADVAIGETTSLAVTFSEAVTDLELGDFTATNGTLSDLASADGITWTATFTPDVGVEGAGSVALADTYADLNGNDGTASTSNAIAVDTVAPTTASIVLDDTDLVIGETAGVTITFSEAVSSLDLTDFSSENGVLSNLVMSTPTVWTATFTPTAAIEDPTNVITLADTFTDVAGNDGTGVSSANYTVETVAPTANSITLANAALLAGETTTAIIVFSEAVTDLTEADFSVDNGMLSGLTSSDGITWTATLTPAVDTEAMGNTVTLTGGFTDLAGNAGTSAVSATFAVETLRPTATITLDDSDLIIGETSTVTITFSEAVTGLELTDLTAENGELSALATADMGVTWTATFTPTAEIEDPTNVITLADTYTDVAGNAGTGASSANYTVDTSIDVGGDAAVALVDTDGFINANDVTAVQYTISGVDATSTPQVVFTVGSDTWTSSFPAGANGTFSIDLSNGITGLPDGPLTVSINLTDAAGNMTTGASDTSAVIDTAAPAAPVITGLGTDTLGTVANDATPQIIGTGEVGATVAVSYTVDFGLAQAITETAVVDANGDWSITPSADLVATLSGSYAITFTAIQTDPAGNPSAASSALPFELDFAAEFLDVSQNSGTPTEAADNIVTPETDAATATGTLTFEDIPVGQSHAVGIAPGGTGYIGNFLAGVSDTTVADTTGAVTWTFEVANALIDYLAAGETIEQTYDISLIDGDNDVATETITVTITGTNDAPTIDVGSGSAAAAIDEANIGLTANGTLDVADVDTTNTVSVAVTSVATVGNPNGAATLGMMTADIGDVIANDATTGTINWSFDSDSEAFNHLSVGESLLLTYTITATDSAGAAVTQDVAITINGTNDGPTLDAGTGGATEGGATIEVNLAALGADLDTDDSGASLIYTVDTQPSEGTATIAAGSTNLTFDPGSDFQDLGLNDTRDVTIVVQAEDAHGAVVTNNVVITVTGTNDAPTLAAGVGAANEDGATISIDLVALGDDVDLDDDGDSLIYSIETQPAAGSAGISADGNSVEFTPGADFQSLAFGETTTATIVVRATDSEGEFVTNDVVVTVTGTNDAPSMLAGTGTATEDAGDFTVDLSALGNDIDSNNDGSDLVYTVTGAPAEGLATIASGTTDLVFNTDGDFQDLAQDETRDVTVQVTATDASGLTAVNDVVITVTGTNDNPTLTAATVGFGEDALVAIVNLPAFADDPDSDDTGATLTYAITTPASEGTATIADGNQIRFYPGSDFQDLAEGDNRIATVGITATDSNGGTVTTTMSFSVTGSNDAPTVTAGGTGTAFEDGASGVVVDLTTLGDDIDSDDDGSSLTYAITSGPAEGAASINGSGGLVFDPGTAFQDLAEGETRHVTVGVTANDGTLTSAAENVTITVTGVNDDPTLGSVAMTAAENGTAQTVDLSALGNDVDSNNDGSNLTYSVAALPAGSGTASILGDGVTLSFDPGSDFQYLAVGQQTAVAISVTAEDADGGTVTTVFNVTVTGVNTDPTFDDGTGGTTEGGANAEVDLTELADDIDNDDTPADLTYSIVTPPAAGFGSVSLTGAGSSTLSFAPGLDFEDLADGETRTATVTVRATDTHGATADADVVFTVTGTNDGPQITETDTVIAAQPEGDAALSESGTFAVTDVDTTNTVSVAATLDSASASVTTALTTAQLEAMFGVDMGDVIANGATTGTVNWTFDSAAGDFDFLNDAEAASVVYTVTVTDSFGDTDSRTVTINLTGTNDAPTITAGMGGAVEDGAQITVDLAALAADLDAEDDGSTMSYAITSLAGVGEGTATISGTDLVFDPGSDFQGLGAGITQVVDFTVEVTDAQMATASATISITVTGTNDVPVLSADVTAATITDTAADDTFAAVTGTLTTVDADSNATATYGITGGGTSSEAGFDVELAGTYGTLYLSSTGGGYEYRANDAAVEALQTTETDVFTLTVTDDQMAGDTQTLTITLAGDNDTPVITGTTASTNDQAAAPITVQLLDGVSSDRDGDDLDIQNDTFAVHSGLWSDPVTYTLDAATGALTLDPTQFAALDETETVVLRFSYEAVDAGGEFAAAFTDITVTGTNNAPIIVAGSDIAGDITEVADGDAAEGTALLTASGSIEFADAEPSDTHLVIISEVANGAGASTPDVADYIGDFSSGISGRVVSWEFELADSVIDSLGAGETIVQTYSVVVREQDNPASQVEEFVTVTITGTNDRPIVTGISAPAVLIEADDGMASGIQALSATATLTVTDADFGGTIAGAARTADELTPEVVGTGTTNYTGTVPADVDMTALLAASTISFTAASATATAAGESFTVQYDASSALDWVAYGETLTISFDIAVRDDSAAADALSVIETL
ncbi:Ig-like domain-containing protein, partial [Sulfitobacter sp. HNIBRBA2951]|uniref:Ig-like domain-containing protein n=1 Tax=Sulfitobacter aquimarinus TaxID=3158557 RepID=UPI0032DFD935